MMLPSFARTSLVGYAWVVMAAVSIGFLSFGLWVHHMFATGLASDVAVVLRCGEHRHRDSDGHPGLRLARDVMVRQAGAAHTDAVHPWLSVQSSHSAG